MKNNILKLLVIIIFLYFLNLCKQLIENDKFNNIEEFNNTTKYTKLNNEEINILTKKVNNNGKDNILFQDYGTTNYIEPKNMTESQKDLHKQSFPNNMTLQDYVNWLLLNRDNIHDLNHIHTTNLQNLLYNKRIHQVPIDSMSNENHYLYDNQFIINNPRIISLKEEDNRTQSDIILPSNYVNYSDYRHNFNVYGLNGKCNNGKCSSEKKKMLNFKTFLTN